LVECVGTQLDRRKTSNPEASELIDKVRRVCGRLASSPPSGEAFKNIQQIWVTTQRNAVQEADLVGHTSAKMRSIESGPRTKRLSTDVSQRWGSSILMIMHVLVNWGVLEALCIQQNEDFLLEGDEKALVQLFSILFRVHIFLRISQCTHMCSGVRILLELRYLLHNTLRCDADLQLYDPRKAAAKNLDIYEESSYTREDKKASLLVPMVQTVRQSLRKAIVKRFFHSSGYACKKRGGARSYMLDMYMYLCPISYNFMQNPKQSHLHVFLDQEDKLPGMEYHTPEEVYAGTQLQVKSLMRKVLQQRKTPAQSEERSSGVSDEQSSGKKRKRQATLSFGGCSSAPSAAVMSVLAEAEVPSTAVQELDIDEVVSEQLEAYKKAANKTLNAENAPRPCLQETCSVSNPDEWWTKMQAKFPLVHEVWQHVSGTVLSSGQIERDFGAASDCLPRKRAKTDARYFQAQLIGSVNFPWMPEAHEMPAQAMSRALVHQNLPEAGFGVPEIYEKVPREDEEDEFRLGNKTNDGFEGEDTCEQGWEELGEESE